MTFNSTSESKIPGLQSTPHPEHPSQYRTDALNRARGLADQVDKEFAKKPWDATTTELLHLGRLWCMIASVEDNRAMHAEAVERQDAMSNAMLDAMTEGMVDMPPHPELPFDPA